MTGRGAPLGEKKFIYPPPRGGTLANFSRGPGDTYIPGGEPLEILTAYPPPPGRTPRDQVRASAHSGYLTGQAPPPLLTHTAQQRGEPGAGSLQGPPGIPHPGGGPWNIPPLTAVSAHPGHQPHQGPLPLHASQQRGGPLAKFLQGPPGYSQSGGGTSRKLGGTPPRSYERPPGPPT